MTTENTIEAKLDIFKKQILPLCVSAETSNNPAKWSRDNPMAGHCAIVSLFLNEQLGAAIIRRDVTIMYAARQSHGRHESHYHNAIGENVIDMTAEQYMYDHDVGNIVLFGERQSRTADYLLSNENTRQRYETFEKKAQIVMAAKKFSFAA